MSIHCSAGSCRPGWTATALQGAERQVSLGETAGTDEDLVPSSDVLLAFCWLINPRNYRMGASILVKECD